MDAPGTDRRVDCAGLDGIDDGGPVVFDIDGVLADVSHRLHHISTRPKDWPGFFAAAHADPPLPQGVALARELGEVRQLLYLTGRPEWIRDATQKWLDRHDLPTGRLLMRRAGDRRPARLMKLERLRDLQPVHAVVDDDPFVVVTLREAGFAVLHATWAPTSAGPATSARETPSPTQQTLWDAQETEGRT